MLSDVVHLLCCPHCSGEMSLEARVLRCLQGHSFDVARQGYVSFTTSAGDTAEMVAAREEFLGAGHYEPIVEAVRRHVRDAPVVDLGSGGGYYLARVLRDGQVALAVDSSRHALRRAARVHPRVGAVGADVWAELPIRDGAAGTVLSIFSPRNGQEIARILHGDLVVVTPTERHLRELVTRYGLLTVDPLKRERLEAQLAVLRCVHTEAVEFELRLEPHDATALIAMGPSAHHGGAVVNEPLTTIASVELSVWRR